MFIHAYFIGLVRVSFSFTDYDIAWTFRELDDSFLFME